MPHPKITRRGFRNSPAREAAERIVAAHATDAEVPAKSIRAELRPTAYIGQSESSSTLNLHITRFDGSVDFYLSIVR